MAVRLDKVIVFVSNVEACADWYARHLGLQRVEATYQAGMWAEIDVGQGTTIAFHQAFGEGGPVTTPTGSPANPHKLVFAVNGVGAARQRLLDEGVTMFDIATEGDTARCDGLDVEGHRFQLVGSQ